MAPKGYTTKARVAQELGITLTVAQESYIDTLIEEVEGAIDAFCGRGWLTGAITDELYLMPGRNLELRHYPVASVQAVSGRMGAIADAWEVLTVNEDYEVVDLAAGYLLLGQWWARVKVSYTPAATVPVEIKSAATAWVAMLFSPSLTAGQTGGIVGVESFKLPDLEVKFGKGVSGGSAAAGVMPIGVEEKLARWRVPPV